MRQGARPQPRVPAQLAAGFGSGGSAGSCVCRRNPEGSHTNLIPALASAAPFPRQIKKTTPTPAPARPEGALLPGSRWGAATSCPRLAAGSPLTCQQPRGEGDPQHGRPHGHLLGHAEERHRGAAEAASGAVTGTGGRGAGRGRPPCGGAGRGRAASRCCCSSCPQGGGCPRCRRGDLCVLYAICAA